MSRRIPALKLLHGVQRDASDPVRQVWLSASAGTGKTHVLTARVLRLLLNGAAPEAILCLTFTKAGAAEMAERVQARLAAWVRLREDLLRQELFALGEATDDGAIRIARRLFARVLDAPGGGLRIQTIHAFCQTLLSTFPAEAGISPGFQPLEGRAEAALARSSLAAMLTEAERGGDLGLIDDVQHLSRRLGEEQAERYLRRCARAPDALAELGGRDRIAARVRGALDVPQGDVEEAIARACHDDAFDCATLRRIMAANRDWGTATGHRHADLAEQFIAAGAGERVAMLNDLVGVARTKAGEPLKFSAKLLACDPEHDANCAALAERVAGLLALRARAELAASIACGLRAGQAYAAAYAAAKRAQGLIDFDDLIRLTTALLGEPGMSEWIRYKLDQRTDHVLVDEGQDTNTDQWWIVRGLVDEFFAAEPRQGRGDTRTIFSVGDFKQAIFGFQGTNPVAFGAARAYFTQRAEDSARTLHHLALDRSFRSSPPILAFVDALIARIGRERLGLIDGPEPHRSAHDARPGTVTIWPPVSADTEAGTDDDGEEGWIDDAQRAFATRLAKQVRAWIDSRLWSAARGRAIRPEDILILVRKRGSLAALIVARLHAEGVAVAGVDRLRLDAPLAVRDLLAAVRFVLQPGDDLNLASLLVSPLFGLDQAALYTLAYGRKGTLWDALAADPVADGLRRLLARADLTSPYQFLEEILSGPLDGRRKLMARLGGEARDPIEELLNAALAFEGETTPTLQRFLDWFDRDEVEVTRDPSAPLDAVRVMTVHGAKGLQAPLVVLADATGDPDAAPSRTIEWPLAEDSRPLPIFRPRAHELAGTIEAALRAAERREREEHWRLLYVAMTRAEERLVIGGALGPRARGTAPAQSWYAELDAALTDLGVLPQEDARWGGIRRFGDADRHAPQVAPLPVIAAERAAPPEWLHQPAPAESRPPRPLAPSQIGDGGPADAPPTAAMLDAARRGQLLHALFERLPDLPVEQRAAAGERWLEQTAGLAEPALRHTLVAQVCAIVTDVRFANLFTADALTEAPIAAVLPDGLVIAGTVDRLLVESDRVRLIDYKTSRRVPEDGGAVPAAHVSQMAAYAAALAVIFPGRRIEPALLYTAGPRLMVLPPDLLAHHKPAFPAEEQKLEVAG